MKILVVLNAGLFVVAAALFAAFFAPSATTLYAQSPIEAVVEGEEAESDAVPDEETNGEADRSEFVTYRYVAQPGDSYTKLARKAVQTFGLKFDVSLSRAQIVFAETNLTQAAGSPLLDLAEEVEIDEADVAEWVEAAQQLSEVEEAAWSTYVPFVDFNTDNVGE